MVSLPPRYGSEGCHCVQYIPIDEQIVAVFTKPSSVTKCVYFRDKLGMAENCSLAEREC